MDEWIALIGGSWHPLLLYPGLLTGLLVTALMHLSWHGPPRPSDGSLMLPRDPFPALLACAAALLLLALLPFPRSYWAYPIDLIGALFLLEAPYWLRLARRLRAASLPIRRGAADEAGAILNTYLLLALAIALLGQGAGSLLLTEVKAGQPLLRWTGLVGWAIALPPLLALGPWRQPAANGWADDMRRIGHLGLLLALALPTGDQWGYGATAIGACICFGSFILLHHFWRGEPARYERLQPIIALVLLGCLLYVSGQKWLLRLR